MPTFEMNLPVSLFSMMSSTELWQGLTVIGLLLLIEGLLSVDNVLGIAALARKLPLEQRSKAIKLGMIGAYVFRVIALLLISILIQQTWVRWLGAGYLIYLMCSHLTAHDGDDEEGESGGKGALATATFGAVLTQIALMDLSLSIDNVIAAVALAPKVAGQPVMWPIYTGVLIAIIALQAIAPYAVKLLDSFPIMEPVAFILIGLVGGILTYEEAWHVIYNENVHVESWQKFTMILGVFALALLYNFQPGVRKVFQPFFAVAMPLMKAFTALVELLFKPITYPIQLLTAKK
jgi:YkoY family integral membrane protein